MQKEHTSSGAGESPVARSGGAGSLSLTRRQALGRLSAVATAGAAAWVAPEILTAKLAGGATLSAAPTSTGGGGSGSGSGGSGSAGGGGSGVSTSPSTASGTASHGTNSVSASSPVMTSAGPTLANTGDDAARDATIGAGLIAGGWALHRWASRTPTPALASPGTGDAPATRSDPSGHRDRA